MVHVFVPQDTRSVAHEVRHGRAAATLTLSPGQVMGDDEGILNHLPNLQQYEPHPTI
ncbi:MAG: hypothetical protein ACJ8AG_16770 [Ktedonobacteraceae bacterium]